MPYRRPLTTQRMSLSNRLVLPPMGTSKADENGHATPALLEHYHHISQGGYWGLVIIEHSYVHPLGRAHEKQLSIADDSVLPQLTLLADIFRSNNTRSCIQLAHAGSTASPPDGLSAVAPSACPHPKRTQIPNALTHDEVLALPGLFADAALRAKKTGFDAVEIHGAHGYLLSQFYSPVTNHREDEYGGPLENRIRLHRQIIAAVRRSVGDHYPILLRLGASDYMPGGCTLEDSLIAAKLFEQDGIEILDVSGGFNGADNPNCTDPGYFAHMTAPLSEALSIPVILTGGITEPAHAGDLLASNAAELIGIGRAALKNPQWAKMAMTES